MDEVELIYQILNGNQQDYSILIEQYQANISYRYGLVAQLADDAF